METIKGVVYYAPGGNRMEQVPMPECGTDELLVNACLTEAAFNR